MPKDKTESIPITASYVMSLPQPPLRNAEEYLKAYTGYVYTAVSSIAQEVASIDLHLFKASFTNKGPETTEIYEHECLSLLRYVNQISTFYDITEATQVYQELTGEAFWVVLKKGDKPREIWLLRPDWVSIIPDPVNVIKEYHYNPGGNTMDAVTIPRENMIHFKYFHPLNPYRGRGSVQSAALPFDILNFAQEYNRNFFFNSAIPSMVFTTDQKISEATVKRFVNQWQASYGGRSKSNKIAFLGNGMKVDKLTVGAKELDFNEQQKQLRDDILAVFKVPKTVLGLTDDVNKANAEATTRAFMERVITPRMRKFVDTLNEIYLPMFKGTENMFLDFTDPSPEDTEMKLRRYDNALKNGWMTPNEVRGEENMEPIEGGDELPKPAPKVWGAPSGSSSGVEQTPTEEIPEGKGILSTLKRVFSKKEIKEVIVPKEVKEKPVKHMMRVPVKRLEQFDREGLEKEFVGPLTKFIGDLLKTDKYNLKKGKKEAKKGKSKASNPLFTEEKKVAYWRQFIEHTTKYEKHIRELAINCFREQEHQILATIDNEVKLWIPEHHKGKAGSLLPSVADMSKLWEVVWRDVMREILIEQGDYTLDFLGVGGHLDVTSEVASEFLYIYGAQLIKGINETTREKLASTLSDGFDKGESVYELKNRVKEVFTDATDRRAEMIARTESLRASNTATVEAYRQSEVVEAKEWLAERDDRTCETCEEMDGKTIGLDEDYFAAGDTVTIGKQTIDIGDLDIGEPPLHPDCRCTTIPVLVGE